MLLTRHLDDYASSGNLVLEPTYVDALIIGGLVPGSRDATSVRSKHAGGVRAKGRLCAITLTEENVTLMKTTLCFG